MQHVPLSCIGITEPTSLWHWLCRRQAACQTSLPHMSISFSESKGYSIIVKNISSRSLNRTFACISINWRRFYVGKQYHFIAHTIMRWNRTIDEEMISCNIKVWPALQFISFAYKFINCCRVFFSLIFGLFAYSFIISWNNGAPQEEHRGQYTLWKINKYPICDRTKWWSFMKCLNACHS